MGWVVGGREGGRGEEDEKEMRGGVGRMREEYNELGLG